MKLMTTHHTGGRPVRARLGACSDDVAVRWAVRWASDRNMLTPGAYMGTATGEQGFGSIKHPARHLGTRST